MNSEVSSTSMSKSSNSGTEEDQDVELEPKKSGVIHRKTLELTTTEAKKFISNQLQQHLELSIKKAIETALEEMKKCKREEESLILPQPKSLGRSHSTPNASKTKRDPEMMEDDSDTSLEEEDSVGDEEENVSCPSAKEPIAMTLILVQASLILVFAFFVGYDEEHVGAKGLEKNNETAESLDSSSVRGGTQMLGQYYQQFQDIQVMIFLGIGVLMSFLRRYGYSAIGFCLLAGTLAVQWGILVRGMIHYSGTMIHLNIANFIFGDFAAAVVLISYGTVIGVATPLQLILMTFLEVIFYAFNDYIGSEVLKAVDTGGSMYVHIFAAYFGLGLSRGLMSAKDVNTSKLSASYNSNIFCLIAVVFLWLFWPSFNCVMSTGSDQHRVVINTILSLFGSCVLGFATSALFNKNKFVISHIQNASLAGGVAIGAVVDLMIRPCGALTIGATGGFLCVFSCQFVQPFITKKLGIHDSCGVHNLHGIPGVFAALVGVVMASIASECDYGPSLYLRYPARAPLPNSTQLQALQQLNPDILPGLNRTGAEQALFQLAAMGMTILISLLSGAFTGLLMRIPIFGKMKKSQSFDDNAYFEDADADHLPLTNSNKIKPKEISNGVVPTISKTIAEAENHNQVIKKRRKYEF